MHRLILITALVIANPAWANLGVAVSPIETVTATTAAREPHPASTEYADPDQHIDAVSQPARTFPPRWLNAIRIGTMRD